MPLKGTFLRKSLETIKIAPKLRAIFRKRFLLPIATRWQSGSAHLAASLALSDTVMRSRRPQYPGADAWARLKR